MQSEKIEHIAIVRKDRSKLQERAQRILDAAAALILRWGYKKTTIDDIARQAGVAKGTIYLHWKTREELFLALFLRESLDVAEEIIQRMHNDPEGALLHRMAKHSISTMMNRPLAKALYVGDIEILGELLRSGHKKLAQLTQQKMIASASMLEFMRSKNVIRTDTSITAQIHTFSAIVFGFMTIDTYLPENYHLSVEEATDALADTIKRTFGPDEPVSASTLQEVTTIIQQTFSQYLAIVKEQSLQGMPL